MLCFLSHSFASFNLWVNEREKTFALALINQSYLYTLVLFHVVDYMSCNDSHDDTYIWLFASKQNTFVRINLSCKDPFLSKCIWNISMKHYSIYIPLFVVVFDSPSSYVRIVLTAMFPGAVNPFVAYFTFVTWRYQIVWWTLQHFGSAKYCEFQIVSLTFPHTNKVEWRTMREEQMRMRIVNRHFGSFKK